MVATPVPYYHDTEFTTVLSPHGRGDLHLYHESYHYYQFSYDLQARGCLSRDVRDSLMGSRIKNGFWSLMFVRHLFQNK